ncbi:glycoside hydrolase family 16 protein, partial [Pseudonocardia sp. KRD-184]
AADLLDWGTPSREDDFTAGLAQWDLYEGTGHAGQGVRSPMNAAVQDGVLTLTGDAAGTTAGMCWGQGQRYGRWEGRLRAPESDPSYDAVLLLWPDDDAPDGGEIDIAEMQDPSRRTTGFHLHHGADDEQVEGRVDVDATRWHAWAVEWTPREITAHLDGRPWFRTTDAATFPPGPMHLCVQLDWFPSGDGPVRESSMQVDWVREYALDGETGDEPR